MKHFLTLGILFFTAVWLCGAPQKLNGEESAKQYSQQLCRAFFVGKYEPFKAMLPESLHAKYNPVLYQISLEEQNKKGPSMLPMHYLGSLRRPGARTLLWKVEYQSKTGELLDRLASTSFSVKDGLWTLTGFSFI